MITIIDTETTGIPVWEKPKTDGAQPRIKQIAAIQYDRSGLELNRLSFLMKRDGWTSSAEAAAVHGIPDRWNDMFGVRPHLAMAALMDMVRNSRAIAAFGLRFDLFMIEIELIRAAVAMGQPADLPQGWVGKRAIPIREIDIMDAAAQVANGGKRIKLAAAHEAIVGAPFTTPHDAQEDAEAAARVFWKLVEMKKMEI